MEWADHQLWSLGTLAAHHPPSSSLTPTAFFLIVPPWPESLSFLTSLEEGTVIEVQPLSLAGLLELIRGEDLWAGGYFLIVCGSNIKANDRGGRLS